MQTTIGLDFGTHQTKICVERINGFEKKYSFEYYCDTNDKISFVLPSIICIDNNKKLHYGFIPPTVNGEIIRYFKQVTFTSYNELNLSQQDAILYSCWYIAYILFDLEEKYGQDFSIQMGVPTDSSHHEENKQLATRILVSAYKLVEEVYFNNKQDFLDTDIDTLRALTNIVDYSDELKYNYGIYVLPEAYACIMPLSSKGKIGRGVNLLIDIGGGTTDISFFTINKEEGNKPRVYYFTSINKAINFLTDAATNTQNTTQNRKMHILETRRLEYDNTLRQVCGRLEGELYREFDRQVHNRDTSMLRKILFNRPLIYCGGGSTYKSLLKPYKGFSDVRQVAKQHWQVHLIEDIDYIEEYNLYPLLSTAYGLSMAITTDEIEIRSLKQIFEGHSDEYIERTDSYSMHDYGLDYDAWK